MPLPGVQLAEHIYENRYKYSFLIVNTPGVKKIVIILKIRARWPEAGHH